jgi:Domain of unknown function (DUF4345)
MAKTLKWLLVLMGISCIAIGAAHFLFGVASVPGEGTAGATVDSRERFYGAIFAGYGIAWIWAARQSPISSTAVRWLAGVFLLGGVGRLVSIAVHGSPNWFQIVLTVFEFVLPIPFFLLASADERASVAERQGSAGAIARPS